MNISFKDKDLEKCAVNAKYRMKTFGALRSKLFQKLRNAENLEKTRYLPGNYHELVGDRKGLWACNLDQPYRLIFEPHEEPIPTDENGKYLWIEIKGVEILEITNYHEK